MKEIALLAFLPFAIGAFVGGYAPQDLKDESILKADSYVNAQLSSKLGAVSLKLVKAETQVVAGLNTKLTYERTNSDGTKDECEVILYTISWKNYKEISENTCVRTKRSIVGGNQQASLTDPLVKSAFDFGVDTLNARSNGMYRLSPMVVHNVQKQLVSGMLYKFTVVLGESTCRNDASSNGKTLQECPLLDSGMRQECHIEVSDQAWMNPRYTLLDDRTHCDSQRKQHPEKQHLLGGDGHDQLHAYHEHFEKFKGQFDRNYQTKEEEAMRFKVFCKNMDKARELQKYEQGTAQYGPTKFADMTEEEFKRYVGKPWNLNYKSPIMKQAEIPKGKMPASFDWRTKNAVTPVKNQGACGSCWAFSTTGNVEGQNAIKSGQLVSLSEQELVDCDKLDEGCSGGLPSLAYESIMKLGGLEKEKDYSYRAHDEKCFFNRSKVAVKIHGAVNISSNEDDMAAWLAQNGPISIGINANAMQFYMGGISHPWKILCNPSHLDHGVLIVGYGVQKSEPYWIIKNSWGEDWGEKGYYLAYRGSGVCGLNKMCTSAKM